MLSHANIWSAIDRLAHDHGLSPSGLARRAGLDATTFNPSKRTSNDGRPRWPSMESIAKILQATNADLAEFVALVDKDRIVPPMPRIDDTGTVSCGVPVFEMQGATAPGFLHDEGAPMTSDWPGLSQSDPVDTLRGDVAIRVRGCALLPLYREGDVVVISPRRRLDVGDRVLVRHVTGSLTAHVYEQGTPTHFDLGPISPGEPFVTLARTEVDWIGRIVWASQ